MKVHLNSLQPGFKLNWYVIEEILGQGGFGITYLAMDTNLDSQVAIKEYLPIEHAVRTGDFSVHPVSEDHDGKYKWGLDRFIFESRTLHKFNHPNIVRVLTVFEDNNTGYMVMPYEQGENLQTKLKGKRTLEESDLFKIIIPILDGLEIVHNAGFIHRDIKPENIYIRKDGSPVLLDFGSARQSLGVETQTLTSLVSPGYAPYEQYYSKSDEQGPWTDIYGLGATLYRAVTGIPPLEAVDRSKSILQTNSDNFVRTSEIAKGKYSQGFLQSIDHALEFKPEDRPQTIRDWMKEFDFHQSESLTISSFEDQSDAKSETERKQNLNTLNLGENTFSARTITIIFLALIFTTIIFLNINWIGGYIGLASSQFKLGTMYNFGDRVEQNYEEAVKWYTLAADQGYVYAQYNLGLMYREGNGVEANPTEAAKWYRMAGQQGYDNAQFNLGVMYEEGSGVRKNASEAIKWYSLAAEQGHTDAQFNLGIIYIEGNGVEKKPEEAIYWFSQAAEQGDAGAQNFLGYLYDVGDLVEENTKEAMKWYFMSAEQGHPIGQYNIGAAYYNGNNVDVDYEEAFKWFMLAAEQGESDAQFSLGRMYQEGKGTSKNIAEAMKWYFLAAKEGNTNAQFSLGIIYLEGIGVPRNHSDAVTWFQLAADGGSTDAQKHLVWVLSTSPDESIRDAKRAIQIAEIYLSLYPEDEYILDNIAAAYAELGEFEKAIQYQKKALSYIEENNPIFEEFQSHLDSYNNGEPWRESYIILDVE